MSLLIAMVVAILSLGYGALAAMANGMSDAPASKGVPYWPMWAGLLLANVILVGRHYGW